jgi:hypothetical protein
MSDKDLDAFKESQETAKIDATKKLRIGIIGTGGIANAHIKSYLNQPDVEIVAGADLIPGKAKAFFESYGVSTVKCDYASGEEMLKEFCDELHKRSFMLGVYCSGMGYTIKSNINSFSLEEKIKNENLERFMCAPPGGGAPVSKICQAQRKSYDMCISQEFTKAVLSEEAEKMASSGLDYIQLFDQNHGGTPYFCFSDDHGHPPVPGKWMVENMNELLDRVKNTVGEGVLLGCESAAGEAYIPYLNLSDNRFNLNICPLGKRLLDHFIGKLASAYGFKAGVVFDLWRKGYLPSECVFFKNKHTFSGASCIYCRRKTSRTCAYNNYIVHKNLVYSVCGIFRKENATTFIMIILVCL